MPNECHFKRITERGITKGLRQCTHLIINICDQGIEINMVILVDNDNLIDMLLGSWKLGVFSLVDCKVVR